MNSIIVSLLLAYIFFGLAVPEESVNHIISRISSLPTEIEVLKIVHRPGENTIHRFFDTSPTSPSNHLIATTSFPAIGSPRNANHLATIKVTNLLTGTTDVIAQTAAWDSQVGAQVQWGASDNELFYNIVCSCDNTSHQNTATSNKVNQSSGQFVLRGAMYNQETRRTKLLDCPVYHISSDGLYGVAPNMLKIHHTQKGYGIRSLDSLNLDTKNLRASVHDGLYLTNTNTGTCSMFVTLHKLATAAGIDSRDTPMYGFHTKFSSDGKYIMFVVRSLETPVSPRVNPVRVQHLFVLNCTTRSIRRVISWASYPFRPKNCITKDKPTSNSTQCPIVYLRDGNHPNWVPNSHNISMNLQSVQPVAPSHNTVHGLLEKAAQVAGIHTPRQQPAWNIVSFNVDQYPTDFIYKYDMDILLTPNGQQKNNAATQAAVLSAHAATTERTSHSTDVVRSLIVTVGHTAGSGHPIYHPSGDYIITDAYPKEMQVLLQSGRLLFAHNKSETLRPLSVPLRLIEVATQREVWLLQMQVERNASESSSPHNKPHPAGRDLLSTSLSTQLLNFFAFKATSRAEGRERSAKSDTTTGMHMRSLDPTVEPENEPQHRQRRGLSLSLSSPVTNVTAQRSQETSTDHLVCPAPVALFSTHTSKPTKEPQRHEDKSWRCDLHPAWSRDFQYVTINGRPQGAERQVFVLHVGDDLSRYFPPLMPVEAVS